MDPLGDGQGQSDDREISEADGQRALGRCRIKRARASEGGRDLLHRALNGASKLAGTRRRLHPVWRAYEEVVLEEVAEAVEGVAHRRLSDADPRGRQLHTTLRKQGVERL